MSDEKQVDARYRAIIDRLVDKCSDRVLQDRVLAGVWNRNASATSPDADLRAQHHINVVLESLTREQRDVVASLLTEAAIGGAFDALVVLYEEGVEPLDAGYEGDPFHDFVGRLDDWEWPNGEQRWGSLSEQDITD